MKLLSIAIPCYNSAAYMENCVNSLLPGGEDVEIIIVDDGSQKDDTPAIADRLALEHPGIVKAIHQENGGHGEAVNTGIKNATGLYFKVVDSDDKVNPEAYKKILSTLKSLADNAETVDMFLANYVYDKEGVSEKKVINYKGVLPEGRIFGWDETGHFKKGQYILMHSVIYRTALLKKSGMVLPKHTFYVDNIYVFEPLPLVKTMYYLNVDFYLYYIGREDQSVNEKVMISRVDQQIRVNRQMFTYFAKVSNEMQDVNPKVKKYMYNYLEIITTISSILLILSKTGEALEKKKALWKWMKETDEPIYRKLRTGLLGVSMNLPGSFGRGISVGGYHIAQKLFHFN